MCLVLKDDALKNELITTIKNYNFSEMDGRDGFLNFKNLIDSWLDLQSVIINVAVSAAKSSVSDLKKDTEKFLRDGIPQDAVLELRELATSIKNINRRYSTGVLSPEKVIKLNKIEVLQYLNEKNLEINRLISNSDVKILYKLEHLSSEYINPYINPITKKKLININLARQGVDSFFNESNTASNVSIDKSILFDKWKRKFIKLEKNSLRKYYINKYLQDPINFVFPVKL